MHYGINLKDPNEIFLTFDVDWANDEICKYCVALLRKYKAKATFFATHPSEFLQSLSNSEDIEIGIHPNYLANANHEYVIDELLEWYPNAKSVRSHGLCSSSNITKLYYEKGLKVCVDIFLPNHPGLEPVWRFGVGSMIIAPYFWEDDSYFSYYSDIDFEPYAFIEVMGMKIFNFHPVHVFANTNSTEHYNAIKSHYHNPQKLWESRPDLGIESFFIKLLHMSNILKGLEKYPQYLVIK